jgi:hypothetical protein
MYTKLHKIDVRRIFLSVLFQPYVHLPKWANFVRIYYVPALFHLRLYLFRILQN